eukprot:jgi/Tetstr1/434171/TSEL_023282.t1
MHWADDRAPLVNNIETALLVPQQFSIKTPPHTLDGSATAPQAQRACRKSKQRDNTTRETAVVVSVSVLHSFGGPVRRVRRPAAAAAASRQTWRGGRAPGGAAAAWDARRRDAESGWPLRQPERTGAVKAEPASEALPVGAVKDEPVTKGGAKKKRFAPVNPARRRRKATLPIAAATGAGAGGGRFAGAAWSGTSRAGGSANADIKDEDGLKTAQQGATGFLDPDQYYPTVLPLEPPGMESLDMDDEIAAPPDLATAEMVEGNAAEEMGLLSSHDDDQLLLFQMPDVLPIRNPKAGQRSAHRELLAQNIPPELPCMSLSKLPAGKIGKLLVFESGKVKMQIGEVLLDVQPGVPCGFRQDVGAMNAEAGHAVFLGDVAQRVVCSPDMEQLLAARPAPQLWDYAPAAAAATTQPKKQEEDQAGVKKEED